MTRLYLVRHCEAEGNIKHVFQGSYDADISENGKEQLARLKERFRGVQFDTIYSSPLKRAFKTAQAIDSFLKKKIICVDGLREINGGHWEGKNFGLLPELYPDEYEAWANEPWNFSPKGGESMRHIYDRIWNTIISIMKENEGKTVVIASHGCAIRNFICRAKGLPLERMCEVNWLENTSVSTFEFDKALNPIIIGLDDYSHLDNKTYTLQKQTWWRGSVKTE